MGQPKAKTTKSPAGDRANAKAGDLVALKGSDNRGIVTEIHGRKWLKVAWSYGCIYNEHIDDLNIVERKEGGSV